eukprot:m.87249 g.87249  ORF g.87249 m.87249 type:complete len:1398 (+) comp36538_c0_seq6:32-4225(+)
MSEKWLQFAEDHGFQCIPSPVREGVDLPGLSVPFCLQIKLIEGIAFPKRLSNKPLLVKLNLCVCDAKNRRFYGRSWSTQPVPRKSLANRKDALEINQNVYFHSLATETTTMILIELVACEDGPGNPMEISCGWTYLAPFGNVKLLPDSSVRSNLRQARVDFYQGSPRLLLCIHEVMSVLSSASLRSQAGCHLHYSLFVHSAMQPMLFLMPSDTFVGAWDQMPGLHGQTDPPSAIDLFWRPQLSKCYEASIEKLSLNFFPTVEMFELNLLDSLNADRQAKDNIEDDIGLKIIERRLVVGVHNGWKFVKRPHVAYLDLESRRASRRGSHRRGSLFQDGGDATATQLHLPTVIQLTDLVNHPLYAIVFMLEFVMSWPLKQKDKMNMSVTKAQSETVMVSWGVWTPSSAMSVHQQVEINVCGGVGPNPRQRLVYGTAADDDQQVGCGTIKFQFSSQLPSSTTSRRVSAFSNAPTDVTVSETAAVQVMAQELMDDNPEDVRSDVDSVSGMPEDGGPLPSTSYKTPTPVRRPKTSTPADELHGPRNELSQLPFTPVTHVTSTLPQSQFTFHGPLPTTLPHPHPLASSYVSMVPRAVHAQLHDAGFVDILDGDGCLPVEVDLTDAVHVNVEKELRDELQCNQITLQFLAISQCPNIYKPTSQDDFQLRPMYESVFFTFQFYRFSEVTSERLNLVSVDSDSLCILRRGQQQSPGLEIRFDVDPAEFEQNESRFLFDYLQTRMLQVDIWDGDSLLHLGIACLPLVHLIRQIRTAVRSTHDVPIAYNKYSEDASGLVGDLMRGGSVRPPGGQAATEIRGILHTRLVNVGAKSSVTPQGATPNIARSFMHSFLEALTVSKTAVIAYQNQPKNKQSVRGHRLVEIDRELASVIQSRKLGHPSVTFQRKQQMNGLDTEARQRKLKRMEFVRQTQTPAGLRVSDRWSNQQRAQELRTVVAFRERHKDEKIAQALCESITANYTVHSRYGVASFFEYVLKNPYETPVTLKIVWNCDELNIIVDIKEWMYFKRLSDVTTPLEEDMFVQSGDGSWEIFLKARETVYIPFKHQTLHPPPDKTKSIKVSFLKSQDQRPVGILLVKIKPLSGSIDQTFRFQHPEQSFMKKSIIIPPWHVMASSRNRILPETWEDDKERKLQLCCSDSNVVCEVRKGAGPEPSQIFIKVACQTAPSLSKFFLLLYLDPYRVKPIQTWQFYVHSLQRIDFSAVQGQTSHLSVVLRGSSAPCTVQCYSSHPQDLVVHPTSSFQLAANAAHELQLSFKSMETGAQSIFVNIVDVDMRCLVKTWLVCVNSRPPVVTKAFEQMLYTSDMAANKKITYQNPYSVAKRFHLFSTCPEILQFKEDTFDISGVQSYPIGLRFMPQRTPTTREILIFINNDDDKTEECFCVKAVYNNK